MVLEMWSTFSWPHFPWTCDEVEHYGGRVWQASCSLHRGYEARKEREELDRGEGTGDHPHGLLPPAEPHLLTAHLSVNAACGLIDALLHG